jgi:hypothetical protein
MSKQRRLPTPISQIAYGLADMNTMSSYFGWIDFTDEDQKRAQDYLQSLSEGTLDELGFGIIRDAFTDLFFPATSTIMTRARYYILVPSIYLAVLERGDSGASTKRTCDRLELALMHLHDTQEIDGSIPSAIT